MEYKGIFQKCRDLHLQIKRPHDVPGNSDTDSQYHYQEEKTEALVETAPASKGGVLIKQQRFEAPQKNFSSKAAGF